MTKHIQRFTQERIKDLEAFLNEHPDSEILAGEHYSIQRDTTYIPIIGNKKIQSVPRPRERPYQIPVIYCVHENAADSREPIGPPRIKIFAFSSKIDEINSFLSQHYTIRILIIPTAELTCPLDNYYCGDYGPVPDRQPMYAKTHQIIVVYKD